MTTEERVLRIISDHLCIAINKIKIADRFVDDLGADSLDTIELLMAFEEDFDIELDDSDIPLSLSIEQAINRIDAESNKKY